MASDFYIEAASARANQIECELAACKADLLAHKSNSDVQGAVQAVQQIANLEAEKQNLTALYQSYTASQQPPPPESAEMQAAKPISEMNYQEIYDWTKKNSKIGIDDDKFRAGIAEVARRRARGE